MRFDLLFIITSMIQAQCIFGFDDTEWMLSLLEDTEKYNRRIKSSESSFFDNNEQLKSLKKLCFEIHRRLTTHHNSKCPLKDHPMKDQEEKPFKGNIYQDNSLDETKDTTLQDNSTNDIMSNEIKSPNFNAAIANIANTNVTNANVSSTNAAVKTISKENPNKANMIDMFPYLDLKEYSKRDTVFENNHDKRIGAKERSRTIAKREYNESATEYMLLWANSELQDLSPKVKKPSPKNGPAAVAAPIVETKPQTVNVNIKPEKPNDFIKFIHMLQALDHIKRVNDNETNTISGTLRDTNENFTYDKIGISNNGNVKRNNLDYYNGLDGHYHPIDATFSETNKYPLTGRRNNNAGG